MADKKDYGSTTEDDPLVDHDNKKQTIMSASRLPLVIGLDNADFRHAVFGIILFTWLLPSFLAEVIKLADGGCQDPQYCDTWIASYVIIFVAMGFYKWMFMYVWYKDFSDDATNNKCITLLKYSSGGFLFAGGVVLIVAVGKGLDDLCMTGNAYCRAGTFGIYLFPILTILVLSADILFFRYDIGSNIRMRCGAYSGIIFICSLLITSDLFGSETSFNSSTMGVYQVGWLITCIISFIIYIYVALGYYKNMKKNNIKAFYAVSYLFLMLLIGPTMTLISNKGYMDVSRTTFLVLGLCSILNVELFLL